MPLQNQIVRVSILMLLLSAASASSQQTPQGSDYAGPMTKEQLLQSSRWRQVERKFDEWLSVQRMYNEAQVAQVKARLNQKVRAMSASQLEDFIAVSEEKLELLLGSEATEARTYMSYYTDGFLKKEMGKTPDIVTMTPTQMRQELSEFQQKRAGRAQAQTAFNKMQTQNAEAVMKQRSQQQAQLQAQKLAVRNPSYWNPNYNNPYQYGRPYARSPYAPQQPYGPYVAGRPQFTVSPWGGVWRNLP